ncbi:hypothetical protein IE9_05470 [Bacillus cereus BAG4X12-1]|nr:hypothetical protein IE9_05470 [Bacillus cereus BAG4X12-1]EOP77724.1 hypothetical protein IEG_05512 [Bacillus cereus BAG5X12-1]
MKITFDAIKEGNFDFTLLEARLLKTFKLVDSEAVI